MPKRQFFNDLLLISRDFDGRIERRDRASNLISDILIRFVTLYTKIKNISIINCNYLYMPRSAEFPLPHIKIIKIYSFSLSFNYMTSKCIITDIALTVDSLDVIKMYL